MEVEENAVLWSGRVEKKGGLLKLYRWRTKVLSITKHSVLVCRPHSVKGQRLILKDQIVDVHYSNLSENPLELAVVLPTSVMNFRCQDIVDRDAIAKLLKPEARQRSSADRRTGVSLESFVRSHIGAKSLHLQKLLIRKHSRQLYTAFWRLKILSLQVSESQRSTFPDANIVEI